MNKLNEKANETVNVQVSAALLNQLEWGFPAGNVEQRVDFCLRKVVEESQKKEGITYPEDRSYRAFEHVEVKT